MKTKVMEELWNSNKNTIYKLSHDFWNSYPKIEWEEYYGCGLDCFIRCILKYNQENGNGACFNTYLHFSIKQFFKGMIQKHSEIASLMVVENPLSIDTIYQNNETNLPVHYNNGNAHIDRERAKTISIWNDNDRLNILRDQLNRMSDDGFKTKGEIRAYLLKKWNGENIQNRITASFNEVRKALKIVAT